MYGNDVHVFPAGFEAGRCDFDEEVGVRTGLGLRTGCASRVSVKIRADSKAVAKIYSLNDTLLGEWS